MPTFRVLRRVDAWIDYVAEIEAKSPTQAVKIAHQRDDELSWHRAGEEEFWNARFVVLDAKGDEQGETEITRG